MMAPMIKRSTVALLWFLSGWVTGSMVSFAIGLPWWIAPVVGIAAALHVAVDPLHLVWRLSERESRTGHAVDPRRSSEASL